MSGPAGHRSPAARYELVRSSWSGAALHVRVTLWGRPGGPVVDEHLCVALDAPAHLLHHADVLLGQGEEPGARLLDRFPGAAVVGLRRGTAPNCGGAPTAPARPVQARSYWGSPRRRAGRRSGACVLPSCMPCARRGESAGGPRAPARRSAVPVGRHARQAGPYDLSVLGGRPAGRLEKGERLGTPFPGRLLLAPCLVGEGERGQGAGGLVVGG